MLTVDIRKTLPQFTLNVAFEVEREILVLFGPSGAGKSLTLRCIAGLVRPDAGLIALDGRVFFRGPKHFVPPHRRGIGVVFQGYALFPHMTVAQNVAYGLRYAKNPVARVEEILHRMRLEKLAHRYPHQLSGGQQQRVALGRALILRPRLLLLDEPFAALDRGVREHLQADIAALQREWGLTVIYITHNLEDAFALGDRLAVLQAGRLRQIGPIGEVFNRPASRSVAEITGVKNIWEGEVVESSVAGLRLRWGEHTIELPPANCVAGQRVIFYIRPEDVKIIRPGKPLTDVIRRNRIRGTVRHIADRGIAVSMTVACPGAPEPVHLRFPPRSYEDMGLRVGQEVTLSLLRDAIVLIPGEGEAATRRGK